MPTIGHREQIIHLEPLDGQLPNTIDCAPITACGLNKIVGGRSFITPSQSDVNCGNCVRIISGRKIEEEYISRRQTIDLSQYKSDDTATLDGIEIVRVDDELFSRTENLILQYRDVDRNYISIQRYISDLAKSVGMDLSLINDIRLDTRESIRAAAKESQQLREMISANADLRAEAERAVRMNLNGVSNNIRLDDIPPNDVWQMMRRFWRRVDVKDQDDCWLWTGGGSSTYGSFYVYYHGHQKAVQANRFSYMICKGPIPDGKVILHSCDNKTCANPNHLRAGTMKENVAEAIERGLNSQKSPMTIDEMFDAYEEWTQGLSLGKLAKKYKRSYNTIRKHLLEINSGALGTKATQLDRTKT